MEFVINEMYFANDKNRLGRREQSEISANL